MRALSKKEIEILLLPVELEFSITKEAFKKSKYTPLKLEKTSTKHKLSEPKKSCKMQRCWG